jgi:hypothetical protein
VKDLGSQEIHWSGLKRSELFNHLHQGKLSEEGENLSDFIYGYLAIQTHARPRYVENYSAVTKSDLTGLMRYTLKLTLQSHQRQQTIVEAILGGKPQEL